MIKVTFFYNPLKAVLKVQTGFSLNTSMRCSQITIIRNLLNNCFTEVPLRGNKNFPGEQTETESLSGDCKQATFTPVNIYFGVTLDRTGTF